MIIERDNQAWDFFFFFSPSLSIKYLIALEQQYIYSKLGG